MKRVLALALLLLAGPALAYTHVWVQQNGKPYTRVHWTGSSMPVVFKINNQTGPALPNLLPGSDPVAAIERSLLKWPAISSIALASGTTDIADAGRDGTNLITFARTDRNLGYFEATGAVGFTIYFFSGDTFTETDILFNPDKLFTTTAGSQKELDALKNPQKGSVFDVEAIATHELGHAVGLHHTGVEGATMWAIAAWGERILDPDDIAAVRTLYPVAGGFGSIRGQVTVGGSAAFGAQVVAADTRGPQVSALTMPDGSYEIDNLAPGSYEIYVEPLDGPHTSVQMDVCERFSNMSGAGLFSDQQDLTTNFATDFLGGDAQPTRVTLGAGQSFRADFALPALAPGGKNALNPTLIGRAPTGGSGTFSVGYFAFDVYPGTQPWVAVFGPGIDQVAGGAIRVAGDGVEADLTQATQRTIACAGKQFPVLLFPVTVAPEAEPGSRSLILSAGNDLSVFTGALRVVVCPGDCSHNGSVSVDELLIGIRVALGERPPADCLAFDRDGNGRVDVDELVGAVGAALDGCYTL